MNQHLQTAQAGDLPRLLFQSLVPTDKGDGIGRATGTAGRRWPVLQPSLEGAAQLVRANGLYETPREAAELALVRLPAGWPFRAVSPSPTGLACSCDGWPPAIRAGPGDGLYCADILAYLLALYLGRRFSPLPCSAEELWQAALEELRLQMTKATFNQWLLGSAAVLEASTPLSLTVAVRNRYAREWLAHRLHSVIVRTLAAVAGYRVQVRFVVL
ncbi:MAG: DnaA N-terminal domain-containing protein [Anaerolineae bacterium]|nr:DnaA N-terminal domain-containing protein [Anaerolineae bacterium]